LFVVGVVGLLAFQVFPFCALTHLSYRFLTQDSELTNKKQNKGVSFLQCHLRLLYPQMFCWIGGLIW